MIYHDADHRGRYLCSYITTPLFNLDFRDHQNRINPVVSWISFVVLCDVRAWISASFSPIYERPPIVLLPIDYHQSTQFRSASLWLLRRFWSCPMSALCTCRYCCSQTRRESDWVNTTRWAAGGSRVYNWWRWIARGRHSRVSSKKVSASERQWRLKNAIRDKKKLKRVNTRNKGVNPTTHLQITPSLWAQTTTMHIHTDSIPPLRPMFLFHPPQ